MSAAGSRLHHWTSVCKASARLYSATRASVDDLERTRLLTSFYYQGAIDKVSSKVCGLSIASWLISFMDNSCMF